MAKRAKAPPGCYWRGATLWARVEINGQRDAWSLKTSDPAVASRRRQERKDRLIAETFGDAERSLDEAIVAWQAHLGREVETGALRPSTQVRYLCSMEQLSPYLEGRHLSQIDMRLLNEIAETRGKVVTKGTVKRDFVALSSLLNFAIDKGWIDSNPVLVKLGRIKEGRRKIYVPRLDDIELALARAPMGMLAKIAHGAMMTGARLDELVTAQHDQIDHARKQLTVTGKGDKRRVIDLRVMNGYEFFAALPAYPGSPYLFWHGKGEPYRNASSNFANNIVNSCAAWARQARVAFHPFRFHDLRHWHAIEFLKGGWGSIYDLKQRLGHASLTTTELYLRGEFLTEEEIVAAKYGTRSQLKDHRPLQLCSAEQQ